MTDKNEKGETTVDRDLQTRALIIEEVNQIISYAKGVIADENREPEKLQASLELLTAQLEKLSISNEKLRKCGRKSQTSRSCGRVEQLKAR